MFAFEKSVGGIIFRKENGKIFYLLLHYRSGHWDFVKGHQEKGENDEETLRRETEEETGITDLEIISGKKKQIRFFYRAKGEEKKRRIQKEEGTNIFKRVIFYAAETKTREVRISFEHIGYDWVSLEEAMKKVTFQNARNVLEYFGETISKGDLPKEDNLN